MILFFISCFRQPTAAQKWASIPIPSVSQTKAFVPPTPIRTPLKDNAQLLSIEKTKIPLVYFSAHLPGGFLSDGEKWGRADVTAEMLLKSSGVKHGRAHKTIT